MKEEEETFVEAQEGDSERWNKTEKAVSAPEEADSAPLKKEEDNDTMVMVDLTNYEVHHIVIEEEGLVGCNVAKTTPPKDLLISGNGNNSMRYACVIRAEKMGYERGIRKGDWFLKDATATSLAEFDDVFDKARCQPRPLHLYLARRKESCTTQEEEIVSTPQGRVEVSSGQVSMNRSKALELIGQLEKKGKNKTEIYQTLKGMVPEFLLKSCLMDFSASKDHNNGKGSSVPADKEVDEPVSSPVFSTGRNKAMQLVQNLQRSGKNKSEVHQALKGIVPESLLQCSLAVCFPDSDSQEEDDRKNKSTDDDSKYTEAFFQQLLDQNKAKLQPRLPQLDASQLTLFKAACQHVQDCNTSLQDAQKKRDEIEHHKPVDQDALDKANKQVEACHAALDQAQKDATNASTKLLDGLEQNPMKESTYQLLLTTNVLVEATPKGLAAYCAGTTEDHKKVLVQLLQDPRQFNLLQSMVLAGGAKHGKYGQALELYNQLQAYVLDDKHKALWQRMALAIALEFADPLLAFGYKDVYIDPIQRFLHYRQAYQFGELDPVFATEFGVWELRMALNSVAPNDQLAWGRQMLRNYRPDLMLLNDKWRYCRVVRTDVYYTTRPNWDPDKPLDFKQVLSGGGACGPRAWMGRFICRAFGIPCWGVREPGHAAMARWTADEGWVVCLGAEMEWAWWEQECGLHFRAVASARKVLQPKDDLNKPNLAFGQKVMTLEWIANINAEPVDQVVRRAFVDPAAVWRSLSLLQMKRLAPPPSPPAEKHLPLVRQLEQLKFRSCTLTEGVATLADGTIIIPASTCTTKPSANNIIMDSFLGGKQLFLVKDGHAEYTLVSPPAGKYQLTCHFVTVHDDKPKPAPLLVTIDGGEDEDLGDWGIVVNDDKDSLCSVYSVPLPCTWGMWEETEPVVVDLPAGVATCTIAISREATARGLVIKDFKLEPVTRK